MMMMTFNEHPAFVPPPYGEGDDTNDDWSEDDEIHEGDKEDEDEDDKGDEEDAEDEEDEEDEEELERRAVEIFNRDSERKAMMEYKQDQQALRFFGEAAMMEGGVEKSDSGVGRAGDLIRICEARLHTEVLGWDGWNVRALDGTGPNLREDVYPLIWDRVRWVETVGDIDTLTVSALLLHAENGWRARFERRHPYEKERNCFVNASPGGGVVVRLGRGNQ